MMRGHDLSLVILDVNIIVKHGSVSQDPVPESCKQKGAIFQVIHTISIQPIV